MRFIEWLLGLENIRLDRDAPLLLKWNSELPSWLTFALSALALLLILLPYWRERASRRKRIILASIRACLIVLVLLIICRPTLVLQQNRVEASYVALLVDVSESMATQDHYGDASLASEVASGANLDSPEQAQQLNRLDLVRRALTQNGAAPLQQIQKKNGVLLLAFTGKTETQGVASSSKELPELVDRLNALTPDGARTDVAAAIEDVINSAPVRRLAAVILASDGQSTDGGNLKDALELARDRQIPVLPLRIGSPDKTVDFEVGPLRADASVFVNDIALIEATISGRGGSEPVTVAVDVFDEVTGQRVLSRSVELTMPDVVSRVELPVRPLRSGRAGYRVEIAQQPREQNVSNNSDRLDIQVLDDRVRILYVDGYPRYEYRYLKNALLREKTVSLSVLLIDADEQFVQEGTDPIRRFPESPEELSRYDVIVFGDVDPRGGWLSTAQMTMLLDFVGNQGGGFAIIAGERSAPSRFVGTPLEKLIPVRVDPEFLGLYEGVQTVGFKPVMTEEGKRSRLFRPLADAINHDDAEAEEKSPENDFAALPELYWYARTLGPRPGASVLAHHPTAKTLAGAMPLLVLGRYGAGKIFFQATDDTWRWRRHAGEFLHDAYWVQLARLLCRSDKGAADRSIIFRTDRKVYPYGLPVNAQVQLLDSELLAHHHESLSVLVTRADSNTSSETNAGATNTVPQRSSSMTRGTPAAKLDLQKISAEGGVFEGSFIPQQPGSYRLQLEEMPGSIADAELGVSVSVQRPDLEGRRPEADHDALERIAQQTGGRVIPLDALEPEFAAIPDRSVQIPDDMVEPLWDSRLILILFVTLITAEWLIRKSFGLL